MSRYNSQRPVWFPVAALLLGVASVSFGASVNVDFGQYPVSYSGTAAAPDSDTYWTRVSDTAPSVFNLADSSESTTTVGIEFDINAHGITMIDWTPPQGAPNLMRDYLYAFLPNYDRLWITGLEPSQTYDLYLYSQNGGSADSGTTFVVNGESQVVTNVGDLPGFSFGRNYARYSNVSPAADGRLEVWYYDALTVAASLNGFQLMDHVVPESSPPSRGRQLILDHGLQVQGQNSLRGYTAPLDLDRWSRANFTTINFQYLGGDSHTEVLGRMPEGASWGRWATDKFWLPGESTYADNTVSIQYLDEIYPFSPGLLADMTAGFETWRTLAPNALTYTGFWGNQLTAGQLTAFMTTARPDMLMFDHYPGFHATRESWYAEMQKYRTTALKGYDGSGNQPIPYGQYLQAFRTSYGQALPSESFLRRQQFVSWAFGFSFVSAFVYSDVIWPPPPAISTVVPVMFSAPGDTSPTPMFDYIAETNRQSRNLAPALERLVSTDIRMIPGKVGGSSLPSVPGISSFSSSGRNTGGYVDHIISVTPRGKNNTVNPSNHSDVLIGYFKPLLEDNPGSTFVDGLTIMIVNGAGNESGLDIPVDSSGVPDPVAMAASTSAELAEWYRLTFDFSTSDFDSLARLSRETGEVELVPLAPTGGSTYLLDLCLPGGTGDLFTFWDSSLPLPTIGGRLEADFDGDGDVDGDDLSQWEDHYGIGEGGNADGDEDSDGTDFLRWQQQFGTNVNSTILSSTVVPEPVSYWLVVLGAVGLCCSRHPLVPMRRRWKAVEEEASIG